MLDLVTKEVRNLVNGFIKKVHQREKLPEENDSVGNYEYTEANLSF